MIGYVAVLAAGYVLGTKAGRERYEQIVGTYRALTSHPATKSMIDAGRRKIAERVSPDPAMIELTEIHTEINPGIRAEVGPDVRPEAGQSRG